jgi:hypothetical protein
VAFGCTPPCTMRSRYRQPNLVPNAVHVSFFSAFFTKPSVTRSWIDCA